jgi:hypothetical protein
MKSDALSAAPNQPAIQEYVGVPSTSNVSATFQPEELSLISIPSDGNIHNVTIAKLDLDAKMSWVCVPKKGAKAYFNVSSIYYYELFFLVWY